MGQRIRVTHGRGKNLQIIVRSRDEIVSEQLFLSLEEKLEEQWTIYPTGGFSIENQHTPIREDNPLYPQHPFLLQFDIKLYVIHKVLSFVIEYRNAESATFVRSVDLCTHNSGRRESTNCKYKRKQPAMEPISPKEYQKRSKVEESEDNTYNFVNYEKKIEANNQWSKIDNNLEVDGIVRAKSFQQYSDIRLKTNIGDIADAMDIVQSLHGKTYQWKKGISPAQGEVGGRRVIGLIAQEVKEVLPEVVDEVDGILSINYTEIIPVLIEAFKQQSAEIQKLKDGAESSDLKVSISKIRVNSKKDKTQQEKEEEEKRDLMIISQYLRSIHRLSDSDSDKKKGSPLLKRSNKDTKLGSQDTYKIEVSHDKPNSKQDANNVEGAKKDEDNSMFFQIVYSSSTKKWKILTAVLLALLIIVGVVTGVVIGIIRQNHSDLPISSDNLLLSPSFEDIDSFGHASGWTGPYMLLKTDDEENDEGSKFRSSDRVKVIPENNTDAEVWPFGVNPYHGKVMLQIHSDSPSENLFYAKTTVPLNTIDHTEIKYFNISTWAASNFFLNSSVASSFFQMNVFVYYQDDYTETFGVDFDYDDKRTWNLKELIIPCRSDRSLEFAEVIVLSTFNGYSFWDMLNFQYIMSDLPEYVRFANTRALRECNGMRICT